MQTQKKLYTKTAVTVWDWIQFAIATAVFAAEMVAGSCLVVAGLIGTAVTGAVLVGIVLLVLAILALVL